jgi:hypothetical protein
MPEGDSSNRGDRAQGADVNQSHLSASYLDLAVQAALDPFLKKDDPLRSEVVTYGTGFLKALPLFMKGRFALPALVGTYAAAEARCETPVMEQLIDAGLGASKGLTLRTTFRYVGRHGLTPGATGAILGISSRFSDAALTRNNYFDGRGNFDLQLGLQSASSIAFNPVSLAFDSAAFGVADVLWARMFNYSRGAVWYKPPLSHALTAGTMGVSSGFGHELYRQFRADDIDVGLLARRTMLHGIVDAAAGSLGGWQSQRNMRLQINRDAPNAVATARVTPFQRGEIVDAEQAALRDGKFILQDRLTGLTTETLTGFVQTPQNAYVRAVFRPNDGTEAFAHRMQSEIAAYGMKSLGFRSNVPVSVARDVELNGVKLSGYIQQMEGVNLAEYVHKYAGNRQSGTRGLKDLFRTDVHFRESYMDAWMQRLLMGEWDNHALNMAVAQPASRSVQVRNIDLGDGMRPASTALDLVPVPGVRQGYDRINAVLYRELSGKKLTADRIAYLDELHKRYSTPEGRVQLESLGMTGQQVEGLLGRMNWFIKQQYWPRQPEAMFYLPLNDARRTIERWLGKPGHGTSNLNYRPVPASEIQTRAATRQ